MSLSAIRTKRLRRTWEPEEKTWNDEMLEQPWEDLSPPLHKATLFALKNVFFFSHATPVQAATIAKLRQQGHSAVVEAPTGSGKTLGFLIPLMERTVRFCDAYVAEHARPPLCRHILGVILSPSRTLAEQTYVVAKSLAARYPYNIQFSLCDGVLERPASVVDKLRRAQRGAGTFIVSTPKDFVEVLQLLVNPGDHRESGDDARRVPTDVPTTSDVNQAGVAFFGDDGHRFVVVIDEADLVFYSPEMRGIVSEFIAAYAQVARPAPTHDTSPTKVKTAGRTSKRKGQKKQKKETPTDDAITSSDGKLPTDFAFVGATVATSTPLLEFAAKCGSEQGTHLGTVALRSNDDFVSQLQNRYIVCDANSFLPVFIQLMNVHASRKHFVFFNNFRTLLFVQKLFQQLCQGARPLLYIKDIYIMYEGMSENARIEQYNKFLTHESAPITGRRGESKVKSFSEEKKNQIFAGGCKREGKPSMGTGAILLCTDIAAFGLDVRDVDYVYHFEPPSTVQSYIHRVGRVGRMGMKGSSILLLPCVVDQPSGMTDAKERKGGEDGVRFHTLTNTKSFTGELQTVRTSLENLPPARQAYVRELSAHNALEEYALPPFAPLTATLRNMVTQDAKVLKLAKNAAMAMCGPPLKREGEGSGGTDDTWFFPKLALSSLLLD